MNCGARGGVQMQSAVRESSGPDAGVPSCPHGQEKHGARDRGGQVCGGNASLHSTGARSPAMRSTAGNCGEALEAGHWLSIRGRSTGSQPASGVMGQWVLCHIARGKSSPVARCCL